MGVIYKLKSEIKDYILAEKKVKPILSCRGLAALVENKFQVKLSKSSVNSIIKEAGLSMPVGRRQKERRRKAVIPAQIPQELKLELPVASVVSEPVEIEAETGKEAECPGALLLKAIDCLIGGSEYIAGAIKSRLNQWENDFLAKTESLIYLPLFGSLQGQIKDLSGLWSLVGKKFPFDALLSYLNELQGVRAINLDILQIISTVFQEVRMIKVNASDGNTLYLDAQLHTIWSTPQIPSAFTTTIYNIKSYINKYFSGKLPFVLFMAPGYDTPTPEFFNFLLGLDLKGKGLSRLTLYGNKFEELEVVPLESTQRRFFVFGLWPWQFAGYRKVKKIGEFKPFYFEALRRDFSLAEIEIELLQPTIKQSVTLRGCALKTDPNEKTRLIILSNFADEAANLEDLANLYLSHWPNLEEAFQDFSRKIELSTYMASSQRFFSTESLNLNPDTFPNIQTLFDQYLKALDLYLRWHFLPAGFEDVDFSTLKEQFYSLPAILKREKEHTLVTFRLPSGFPYLKELEYVCRRLNERQIVSAAGKRLWFLG